MPTRDDDVPAPLDAGSLEAVRAAYAVSAKGGAGVLPLNVGDPTQRNKLLGYEDAPVNASADLGLGCGNPILKANLQPGDFVVDLGSGAGMDCFIAGKSVGPAGHVIGVDMTAEMLTRARGNAQREGVTNVSFRMGEIEHLPVGDGIADCLISNCVINLSLDKPQVYREMNRVLRPGGRVAISDVLKQVELPDELKTAQAYSCWVTGASAEDDMREMLMLAGFQDVSIEIKEGAADIIKDWMPGSGAEKFITSAYITATKPTQLWGFRDDPKRGIARVGGAAECCPGGAPPAAAPAACSPAPVEAGCWG